MLPRLFECRAQPVGFVIAYHLENYKDDTYRQSEKMNSQETAQEPLASGTKPNGLTNLAFWAIIAGMLALSLAIRWSFRQCATFDYNVGYSKWVDHILAHGRWQSLKEDVGDAGPLYFTMLSLSSWLPLPKLYMVKIMSVPFDYIIGFLVFQIVRLRWGSARIGALAGIGALFLPTVMVNSALWGQCDAMYASALLATLYCLLKGKNKAALAAYGVAVVFKPQAIVFLPFVGGLLWRRQVQWRATLMAAASYGACGLPAVLAGKPVLHVIFHWLRQHNLPRLTIAAPNWYQWIPKWIDHDNDTTYHLYKGVGLAITAVAMLGLMWGIGTRPSGKDQPRWLVTGALLCTLVVPFVMPGMHERYFFSADILALIYACYVPRRWIVPVLVQGASFCAYWEYLQKVAMIPKVPESILAVAMGTALIVVWVDFARMTRPARPVSQEATTPVGCETAKA
jgi:Gpi18-like mannosyltransferase